ncbi:MAG: type IX secretion system plug protein domain-containing protein, partial [Flavobacteriales bacterium]
MKNYICHLLLTLCFSNLLCQETFESGCFDSSISYLQCFPQSAPLQPPMIPLRGGVLEFHFDVMSDEQESFQYIIRHCDKNWRASNLMTSEYVSGFAGDQIRDFDVSFNTADDYIHYSFVFPSANSSLRISGNYIAMIYRNDDPNILENRIATLRFIVYEELVTVAPKVTTSSIVSDRFKKQEADCEVVFGNFKVYDPARDLNLSILQNGVVNSTSSFLSPLFIRPDRVSFDYNDGQNTFNAGNEWRHFDLKSVQYVSDELSDIERK